LGSTAYDRAELTECDGTPSAPPAAYASHLCGVKCKFGCTGVDCNCEAWESAGANDLCTTAENCLAACDAAAGGCEAWDFDELAGQCRLFASCADGGTRSSTRVRFLKHQDTASCLESRAVVAKVIVTPRVRLADYVQSPKQAASFEIASSAPGGLLDGCFSAHRVYVTYAGGVCGKGDPVRGLDLAAAADPETTPADTAKISTWARWPPLPRVDKPGAGGVGRYANVPDLLRYPTGWQGIARSARGLDYQENHTLTNDYKVTPDGFCPTNLPVAELPAQFQVHACHKKCSLERALTAECLGYLSGADPDDTDILCADEEMCQYICTAVDSCVSIDMHKDLPRCYLNAAKQCADDYVSPVYIEGPIEFVNHTKFDLQKKVTRVVEGVDPRDTGYSYSNLLRFAPITFPTGGEYTLCFCDATASASSCSTIGDYNVRVGTVHVSGVGCLLSDKNLARATCVPQFQGGAASLRCMDGPEIPPAPDIPPADGPPPKCVPPPRPILAEGETPTLVTVPEETTQAPTSSPTPSPTPLEMDTFCLLEPEEAGGSHTPQGMHRQCQSTAKKYP
jgi:hypothetical protein